METPHLRHTDPGMSQRKHELSKSPQAAPRRLTPRLAERVIRHARRILCTRARAVLVPHEAAQNRNPWRARHNRGESGSKHKPAFPTAGQNRRLFLCVWPVWSTKPAIWLGTSPAPSKKKAGRHRTGNWTSSRSDRPTAVRFLPLPRSPPVGGPVTGKLDKFSYLRQHSILCTIESTSLRDRTGVMTRARERHG